MVVEEGAVGQTRVSRQSIVFLVELNRWERVRTVVLETHGSKHLDGKVWFGVEGLSAKRVPREATRLAARLL